MNALHLFLAIFWGGLVAILLMFLVGPNGRIVSDSSGLMLFLFVWLPSFAAAQTLAWWTCRFFHLQPMGLWNPACPHCGEEPGAWWMIERHRRARRVYSCGLCGGLVELWIKGRVPQHQISRDIPSYHLRPPRFFGRWRRLAVEPPGDSAPTETNQDRSDIGHLSDQDLAAELRTAIEDLIRAIQAEDWEAVMRAGLHPTILARMSAKKKAEFTAWLRTDKSQKALAETLANLRLIASETPIFSPRRKRAWFEIPAGHPNAGHKVVFIRAEGRWHWRAP
jgi:hypothetical protein